MPKPGRQYEEQAATFFRSLGLQADVEVDIGGARSRHRIDVSVSGRLHAFDVKWVVECKDWKRNVPKEKVLVLQSIVQDVGADRGFLLSEKGFQAGTIRCAQYTNITLTSLQDLRHATRDSIDDLSLAQGTLRFTAGVALFDCITMHITTRYRSHRFIDDPEWEHCSGLRSLLEFVLCQSSARNFPIAFGARAFTGKSFHYLRSMTEVVPLIQDLMDDFDRRVRLLQAKYDLHPRSKP
jgi:hypothetical protein